MINLESIWFNICSKSTVDKDLIKNLWADISAAYNDDHRFYHNIEHIKNMTELAVTHQNLFNNLNNVLFAVFYHDYYYEANRTDNEIKSAVKAEQDLKALKISAENIQLIHEYILATRQHSTSHDIDCALFLDLDLSILATEKTEFERYLRNVRKEYAHLSDVEFKIGRLQFTEDLLSRDHIFQTDFFRSKFEQKARQNLKNSLIEELF